MYVDKLAKHLLSVDLAVDAGDCARFGLRPRVRRSCDTVCPDLQRIRKRIDPAGNQGIHLCPDLRPACHCHRERRGAGAKVVDLSFDGSTSHPAYGVKVLLNGELWEGTIDASTGVAVGSGSTTPVSRLGEENQTTLAAFSASGINLSETVAIAEQYGSGKAVSAGLQHNGAKLVLLVVVLSEGSLKEISVEPPERRSRQGKGSAREKKWKRPSSGGTLRGLAKPTRQS